MMIDINEKYKNSIKKAREVKRRETTKENCFELQCCVRWRQKSPIKLRMDYTGIVIIKEVTYIGLVYNGQKGKFRQSRSISM